MVFSFDLASSNFKGVLEEVGSVISILIPILSGIALIYFFWGLSKFILNSSKPEDIKKGREYMLWGILVLFILFTFQTIIGLVSNELEIGGKTPAIPALKTNIQ